MTAVTFIRKELSDVFGKYKIIRDCLLGSEAVKRRGKEYLPMPNPEDTSKENTARYRAYLKRAVFYAFTSRTLAGLVGQVFMREPVVEIPDQMDVVENDATGEGVSMLQSAVATLGFILSYGRCGLFVDYPQLENGATVEQIQSGEVRPTIQVFEPRSIINWRTVTVGALTKLSLVVIAEEWPYHDDGFERKTACQFRVLRLNAAMQYTVEIWREPTPTNWSTDGEIPKAKQFQMHEGPFTPIDANGNPFNEIPFLFVGVRNNDSNIDNPPLYDMADLNIAHFRNSADYEEACYMMGQPTYWFSGMTESWVENILKGEVKLGSFGGVMLPQGGQGGLLQPEPNTMVKEAMDAKERQAVALGAKLVEQSSVQRTATEAAQENASETSILSSSAKNVSSAFKWAIDWCGKYMGLDTTNSKYELNSDFMITTMDAPSRVQLMKDWQAGGISFSEYRAVLRKVGIATLDDDEAKQQIDKEQADSLAATAAAMANAGVQPGQQTNNPPSNTNGNGA